MFDGAMGTELLARGLAPGACPELWNVERPEVVRQIHRDYLDAGADVIETNTFGGNRRKLASYGLGDRAYELSRAGVEIARQVAGERLVAASLGPTGALFAPFGDLSFDDAYEIFREQALAFRDGGADLICVETMMDLQEARAAVLASLENSGLPVVVTMSFDSSGRTMMGVDAAKAAAELSNLGVTALGANCSTGPLEMVNVIKRMREVTELPIMAQPNAGVPLLVGDRTEYPEDPRHMADMSLKLIEAGASIIGGCCGTTPEHIREIAARIAEFRAA